jgi:hypothetical protein
MESKNRNHSLKGDLRNKLMNVVNIKDVRIYKEFQESLINHCEYTKESYEIKIESTKNELKNLEEDLCKKLDFFKQEIIRCLIDNKLYWFFIFVYFF